ncbi:MAG: efflux RND transporter periplasmic adaptor subunit [Alphaproteobacteria bacterium]|nr:efflux RND transporter periplasmic adaptor subunit [Alphaproteobacteria bacterium]
MVSKRLILGLVVVAGSAYGAYSYFLSGGESSKQPPRSASVTVAAASRQDVPLQLSLVGTAEAFETVAVKSRLDSQITEVAFKDGDLVKEGQLLFTLDDRALAAQARELEAELMQGKAQLTNARLQYERAQELFKTNTVAQARVDDTKAAFEAQQAQVAATAASLENVRVMLGYSRITAPISGRAGSIHATRGNNVKANDVAALVVINQVQPLRVQVAIPQRHVGEVRRAMAAGQVAATATHDGADTLSHGVLDYLDNAVDVTSGTLAAHVRFANEDEALWPGMFLRLTLTLGTEQAALTIPAAAIQGDEGARFVFVVDEAGKAKRTSVTVSRIMADVAVIESGLEEGARVITDGLLRVSDGSQVEIKNSSSRGAEQ